MDVVAVVNQKGGVGKTTITLGLAAALQRRGGRSLVLDLDPQANATTGLGLGRPAPNLADVLVQEGRRVGEVVTVAGWPADGGPPPFVAPGSPTMAGVEARLAADPVGAQDRLERALGDGAGIDAVDLVLVDCPPSLGLLTVNALFAADAAVVVTEPAAWASDGVEQILRTIDRIASRRPAPLRPAGIVVNRVTRTRDSRYWHDELRRVHAELLLPPIRQRAAVAEAAAQSLPLHGLGRRAGVAEAVAEFDELLDGVLGAFPDTSLGPFGAEVADVRL